MTTGDGVTTQHSRGPARPRRMRAWAALGLAALVASGCAAIPSESQPEALPQQQRGQQTEAVPEPAPGLDPLSVVREFVEASAEPASDYAASRAYLSQRARKEWQPDQAVAVIEDEFSTVFADTDGPRTPATSSRDAEPGERRDERGNGEEIPTGSPGDDAGAEQTPTPAPETGVTTRSPRTAPDGAASDGATASKAPDEHVVTVRGGHVGRLAADSSFIPADDAVEQNVRLRKENGEWRIVDPPQSVLVTMSDFDETYFRVPVYFFAPESNVLVPDLRYVVASPQSGLPARVVDLLLAGPSDGLTGAVRNPMGDNASLETNVTTTRDGALAVPLTGVADRSAHDKELIAAQVVRSLQTVTTSRVRLLSNGSALVQGHRDWRPGELPSYQAAATPSSDLPGLMVADGRVLSLGNGQPIPGPAGSGRNVRSAAQSLGGDQLAVVERAQQGVRLRVGPYGEEGQVVDLDARSMTRPTWVPATSRSEQSREVWTVASGERVVQVVTDAEGRWVTQSVNSSEINPIGDIDALRLSRDGTRAAMVIGGRVVVAAVVRDDESRASVALRAPRVLQGDELDDAVALDWSGQDALAVATQSEASPVVRVPLDGLRIDQFNSSNLIAPMRGITAAPGRPTVVADATGLWTASDLGDVWRPHDQRGSSAVPFYPG
ncbi:Sporulation and spore germination [Prauserella aidingensis]|uniref:LpqB family beta-propeller domain-containing protein n=1 Tax=Prauserella aidingensis TaxID=387890 RepID=UPI003556F391|nr:Sporulation and spore germination [Prauserella aidingensis]